MDIAQAFEQYSAPIHRYIYRRLNSHELADDLTQDTFEQAMRVWSSVRPATARAWLYRVAHNLVVDYLRRGSLVAWAGLDTVEHVSGLDAIEQCVEREHIEATLSLLKPKYANALRLCLDGGNIGYAALAARAGVTEDTFKTHVLRGKRQFAVRYEVSA
jgi:RNA polymerase sigma factor (sigma-70 family)